MRLERITLCIRVCGAAGIPAGVRNTEAWRVNPFFAVHRTVPYAFSAPAVVSTWNITHIPTGLSLALQPSRDRAARLAQKLAAVPGVDWASSEPNMISVLPRHTRNAIRTAAGLPPLVRSGHQKKGKS